MNKCILTFLLIFFSVSVFAIERDDEWATDVVLPYLDEWIMDNLDYGRRQEDLPTVTVVPDEIWTLVTGLSGFSAATYTQQDNLIMIRHSIVQGNQVDIFLLHELVHFYQIHTDRRYSCLGEMELEAYKHQERFGKTKFTHYALKPNSLAYLEIQARCTGVVGFDKRNLR